MDYINSIISILYFIYTIIISYIAYILLRDYIRIQKEKNDIRAFEIHSSTPNDADALEALDKLIESALTDYILLNRGFKSTNEAHINSEEEKQIANTVAEIVSKRISPILMDKLNFYYSEESLSEVIGTRVYIRVMSYVIDNNTPR